uniref:Uncharacterized protein n=1 Tax=Cacopsylla melanoneura TaxID=428564 RepID=A0A8D9AV70_9HEMI
MFDLVRTYLKTLSTVTELHLTLAFSCPRTWFYIRAATSNSKPPKIPSGLKRPIAKSPSPSIYRPIFTNESIFLAAPSPAVSSHFQNRLQFSAISGLLVSNLGTVRVIDLVQKKPDLPRSHIASLCRRSYATKY